MFYLVAHFVEEAEFFKNTSYIYLPFSVTFQNFSGQMNPNYFYTSLFGPIT